MEKKETMTDKLPSECTTIIVGEKQMADGSRVYARSEDFDAFQCKNFMVFGDTHFGPEEFVAQDTPFRCPLPREAYGYTSLPDFGHRGEWGSAGWNTAGVGESSTETIFSSEKALKEDPYVETGLSEECTFNIVLPYIKTAREGVRRLGWLIEKYGSAEGFGIGFIDKDETWYLENACGHRWLATRMPADKYFCTGNQSRFRDYDPQDTENYMASADLIDFARDHGLYDPSKGKFDFHEAYQRDEEEDHTYNYPRVWGLQKMFSPAIKNDVTKNTFPVFAEAQRPLTISDLRTAFRFHYDGTDHDTYLHSNGKEPYRPVSIFRTCQTHLMQVRPWLPKEIGELTYVAEGMADLSVFLPLYQGVHSYPKAYTIGDQNCSDDSAYWIFRKVMILGMTNYNALAPVIKRTYRELEEENDRKQREMEAHYMELLKESPAEAEAYLQQFSDELLSHALDVARKLTNKLFSLMCGDIQKEYLFHGA